MCWSTIAFVVKVIISQQIQFDAAAAGQDEKSKREKATFENLKVSFIVKGVIIIRH